MTAPTFHDRNLAPWWLYAVLTLSAVTCWCVVLSEQLP